MMYRFKNAKEVQHHTGSLLALEIEGTCTKVLATFVLHIGAVNVQSCVGGAGEVTEAAGEGSEQDYSGSGAAPECSQHA